MHCRYVLQTHTQPILCLHALLVYVPHVLCTQGHLEHTHTHTVQSKCGFVLTSPVSTKSQSPCMRVLNAADSSAIEHISTESMCHTTELSALFNTHTHTCRSCP